MRPRASFDYLSDDLMCIVLRQRDKQAAGLFTHALVCKGWYRLACLTQTSISVNSRTSTGDLFRSLPRLVNLTSLTINGGCRITDWGDRLFAGLGYACPKLTHLEINNEDGRSGISRTGLKALFTACTGLHYLSLNLPDEIELLPSSFFGLSSLTEANLNFGLSDFPDEFGSLKSLRKLTLENMYFGMLPDSFGQLSALTELDISNCKSIYDFPDSIGDLSSLKKLSIFRAEQLEVLPPSLGQLQNLEEVRFFYNESLCELPEPFFRLTSLRVLDLWELDDLPELEGCVSNLVSLEALHLDKCQFTSLPASLCKLLDLRRLKITDCFHLNHLPRSLGSLLSLERLELSNLRNVKSLPGTISKLSNLQFFSLKRCNGIKKVPASLFHNCRRLADLEFHWPASCVGVSQAAKAPPAEAFLAALCRVTSLSSLVLHNFPGISTLPRQIENLLQLKQLSLVSWPSLTRLPDTMTKLTNLKTLEITSCPAFTSKASAVPSPPGVKIVLSNNSQCRWESAEWARDDEEGEGEEGEGEDGEDEDGLW